MMFREVMRQKISFFTFSELDEISGLIHAFTSRQTDNTLTDESDPALVATKKDRLLEVLELQPENLMTVRQVHSNRVVRDRDCQPAPPEADAILLSEPGLFGVIRTADCLPILAVSPSARMLCLTHAGWRGTRDHVARRAVRQLTETAQVSGEDLIVAFGPCIRVCCYQVGQDVLRRFETRGHDLNRVAQGDRLDLVEANRADLEGVGVVRILDAAVCTACSSDRFYSYRKHQDQGRMWLLAGFRAEV